MHSSISIIHYYIRLLKCFIGNVNEQFFYSLYSSFSLKYRFYSTDSTFIHGGVDRPGCVEQPAVGPENISRRINDLNLRDCHAKIRQVDSHPTIGDGVVVQVSCFANENVQH